MLLSWGLLSFAIVATPTEAEPAQADAISKLPPSANRPIDFVHDIRPIFEAACQSCHGPETQKSGYRLDRKANAFEGGNSGPPILPGHGAESPLIHYVARLDETEAMPPKGPPLTAGEVGVLRAWIDQGAPWPDDAPTPKTNPKSDHWAFRLAATPLVPQVADPPRWVRTPVDAFILAKLRTQNLDLSPEADKLTLLRRATFDLTGLPPTPGEVRAFLDDAAPDAYDQQIDRLLASPAFGQRWGRHWLDAVGYVDILGGDNDAATVKLGDGKWRYRDWVVRAFNRDQSFDQFLTDQFAGDELGDWRIAPAFTPETLDHLTATGFLRVAADDTDEKEINTPPSRHAVLQRTIETVASNVMALTVNCAKCHDHKYDPISQRDYYALAATFSPAFNPEAWLDPNQRKIADVAPTQKAEIDRHNAEVDRKLAESRDQLAALLRPYQERLTDAKLAQFVPKPSRPAVKAAFQNPSETRDDAQKQLVATYAAALKTAPEELNISLGEDDRRKLRALQQQAADLETARRPTPGALQAVYDTGPPSPTRLLRRGDSANPGDAVPPAILSVLASSPEAAMLTDSPPYAGTSGRRLALARRLTDIQTPAGALVARVRVNRVWRHLFGKGLVATDDNFGIQGTRPTHPELLEWLVARFTAKGWRLKPLLRELMTSATYRQTSTTAPPEPGRSDSATIDPANDLLGRMRLRRLESEAIRDAILATSGQLDRTSGGPPIPTAAQPDGSVALKDDALPTPTARFRRSLYLLARRNYHPVILNVFDQPLVATNCTARQTSAVVSQSLTMLNDPFVLEQAEAFARRILTEAGPNDLSQAIDLAFRIALSRPPESAEQVRCAEWLRHQEQRPLARGATPEDARRLALTQLAHVLLNSSEFLYIP